jgi:hypothetical protein
MALSVNTSTSVNLSNAVSTAIKSQPQNQVGNLLKNAGELLNTLGKMVGSQGKDNVDSQPSVSKAFGNENAFEADNKKKSEAAKAAAQGGGPKSLGALLAMVGALLVKSIEATMAGLADAAKQLDAATTAKGPTAELNQKIQEMTFNLQQIQQTLNRVNETVTNLSRSESEAKKSVIQNLSV